jgi:C4-dicarboxylate-specific signal transduction histidine kinase
LFASGKFDQYKRDIPYATLAQAFQSLIRPLLSKNEDDLRKWHHALREALECVVKDTYRAGDIVARIRDQVKKAPPRKEGVDLNDAIEEVIALVRGELSKNRVVVQAHLAQELPPVYADRVQLQQVMLNLILNAIEAMTSVDDDVRELVISTELSPAVGLHITVGDSGPGIAPEDRERIFESFYTTKSGGVGIGLSICRSIIDDHGGRLWADAHLPRGAAFGFTLPAHTKPRFSAPSHGAIEAKIRL